MVKYLTKQQIFNKVSKHLLKQKEKSINSNGNCAYRGDAGLKCAIGCLIPNKVYTSDMDPEYELSVSELFEDYSKKMKKARLSRRNEKLLTSLQAIHDGSSPYDWKYSLEDLALIYNLDTRCLQRKK